MENAILLLIALLALIFLIKRTNSSSKRGCDSCCGNCCGKSGSCLDMTKEDKQKLEEDKHYT